MDLNCEPKLAWEITSLRLQRDFFFGSRNDREFFGIKSLARYTKIIINALTEFLYSRLCFIVSIINELVLRHRV